MVRIGGLLACGHQAWVEARSTDQRRVTFTLVSPCPALERLNESLRMASPVDAYMEATHPETSHLLQAVSELLLECPACHLGVDVYCALYVASGLALEAPA